MHDFERVVCLLVYEYVDMELRVHVCVWFGEEVTFGRGLYKRLLKEWMLYHMRNDEQNRVKQNFRTRQK